MSFYDTYVSFSNTDHSVTEAKIVHRYRGGDVIARTDSEFWYLPAGKYKVVRKVQVEG